VKTPKSLIVFLLLALFAAACATYPGTTSLWVGMTRSQALRAMGPPESVSAQGGFEYLNYTLSVKSGNYVVGRPYYVRIVNDAVESFGYGSQFLPGMMPASTPPPSTIASGTPASVAVTADQIHIVSIQPTALLLDRSNHLKVKLGYSLLTQASGMISVSFNTKAPNVQLSLATRTVSPGSGEIEVEMDILPVTWPNRSDVKMMVSLFPAPNSNGARSLASTHLDLAIAK
jgi:hypothetical protein